MSTRWYAGVPEKDLNALKVATDSNKVIFLRLLKLLDDDLQSSIRAMADDDVCSNHALISKQLGIQQGLRKQIEMVNQIIKEK